MNCFEYKVIPAPRNGIRAKGAKGPAARYAGALENAINALAATGWEYLRAESLPMDERQGLTMRKTETYQNILIFRKLVETPVEIVDQAEPEDTYYDINDDYLNDEDGIVIEDDDAEDEAETTEEEADSKT